jgi:hypothetical protein
MTIQRLGYWARGTVLLNQTIPKAGGGAWPHPVDLYVPVGVPRRAVVVLHGGTGTKAQAAYVARVMRAKSATPTVADVNWTLLEYWNCIAVFPQGQACRTINAASNPWNPNGVDTVSADYPNGNLNWSNHLYWSGYDDREMLEDLHAKLMADFPALLKVHLMGHSSGGAMVRRMLRERPVYDHHGITSGPVPLLMFNMPFAPSTVKPLWVQHGRLDENIGIYNGTAGLGDHWLETLWSQQPQGLSKASVAGSTVSGEWVPALTQFAAERLEYQKAIDAYNTQEERPAENYAEGAYATEGTNYGELRVWTYGNGRMVLRLLTGSGHKYSQQQADMNVVVGRTIFSQFMQWAVTTPT